MKYSSAMIVWHLAVTNSKGHIELSAIKKKCFLAERVAEAYYGISLHWKRVDRNTICASANQLTFTITRMRLDIKVTPFES